MKIRQRAARAFVYYGTRGLLFFFRLFSLRFDSRLGAKLGAAAYYLDLPERRKAEKNIRKAFPEKERAWAHDQVKRGFESFGRSVMELIKLDTIVDHIDDYLRVENFGVFEQAYAQGKGVLWITGHIGNWELMPVYFARKGYGTYVVAKGLYDPRMDRLINSLRERYHVHPILRGSQGAGKSILRALRSNGILGMLIDQDTDVQGVFVDFFGDRAFTPRGAADLALKAGASVIAGFISRTDDLHHVITLHGPIEVPRTSDHEKDVAALTQSMTDEIERHIRQHPHDWVWMHERWAKRPPAGGTPEPEKPNTSSPVVIK